MPTYQTAVERVPFYPSSDSVQHIKSVNRYRNFTQSLPVRA